MIRMPGSGMLATSLVISDEVFLIRTSGVQSGVLRISSELVQKFCQIIVWFLYVPLVRLNLFVRFDPDSLLNNPLYKKSQ